MASAVRTWPALLVALAVDLSVYGTFIKAFQLESGNVTTEAWHWFQSPSFAPGTHVETAKEHVIGAKDELATATTHLVKDGVFQLSKGISEISG